MQIIKIPFRVKKEILACGADLKGAFSFVKGNRAYLNNGFGDLNDIGNLEKYGRQLEKIRRTFRFKPGIVACDMHPGYFSTKFAQNYARHMTHDTQRMTHNAIHYVQHHHAHVASCMLDNDIDENVIGVAFDGTGFGTDGRIWGGEFLFASFRSCERIAHLGYVPLPGGEAAIKEPWRTALSYLYLSYKDGLHAVRIPFMKGLDKKKAAILIQMVKNGINSPLTSSAGRFFDGVAALIGVRQKITYEGEAAIELEKVAAPGCIESYSYRIERSRFSPAVIRTEGIIRGIVKDLEKKEKAAFISGRFHNTVAGIIKETALAEAKRRRVKKIVLSGGVFQNRYLHNKLKELFADTACEVYFHKNFSTTDAGIPLGQIAIANAV